MPNTLAHIAAQGAATDAVMDRPDARWILLGCLLPDLPWILHRVVRISGLAYDPYDLWIYAAVQSSLLWSLVLAAGLALVARQGRRTFGVLALGAVLHLLLDMIQTKWGNGAIMFAPFSWDVLNVGWFWPESPVTVVLTLAGGGYLVWRWRVAGREKPTEALFELGPARAVAAALVAALYFATPLVVSPHAEAAGVHDVATLRDREARAGRAIEFDRAGWRHTEDGTYLVSFAGERIVLQPEPTGDASGISIRGIFVNDSTIRVHESHLHASTLRDLASIIGIVAIAAFWIVIPLRLAR